MKYTKFILTAVTLVYSLHSHAGLLFNYSQLALKDLDQMNELVESKVEESKKSYAGKEVPLKEALQAVYSRPNDDDLIEKVAGPLRTQLDELDAWEKVVSQLTDEAINALKNPKAFKPVVQTTYVIFLENLLSELKPYLKSVGFERSLAERIRDAKIEVSKEASNERKIRTMKTTTSPSDIAAQILSTIKVEKAEKPAAKSTSEK